MKKIFHIDTWNNEKTTSRILPVVSYFETDTLQIDKYQQMTGDKTFINEHYYSDKAPLPILYLKKGKLRCIELVEMFHCKKKLAVGKMQLANATGYEQVPPLVSRQLTICQLDMSRVLPCANCQLLFCQLINKVY